MGLGNASDSLKSTSLMLAPWKSCIKVLRPSKKLVIVSCRDFTSPLIIHSMSKRSLPRNASILSRQKLQLPLRCLAESHYIFDGWANACFCNPFEGKLHVVKTIQTLYRPFKAFEGLSKAFKSHSKAFAIGVPSIPSSKGFVGFEGL